jgi:hypothetical protein
MKLNIIECNNIKTIVGVKQQMIHSTRQISLYINNDTCTKETSDIENMLRTKYQYSIKKPQNKYSTP